MGHSMTPRYNASSAGYDDESDCLTIGAHPLGIKPSGNAYDARNDLKSRSGLFASLPDDLVIQILEYLRPPSLIKVGATCKALYAFSRFDELWKSLLVE